MVVKTLITGLVTAVMAAGVAYFSTNPVVNASAKVESLPKSTESQAVATPAKSQVDVVEMDDSAPITATDTAGRDVELEKEAMVTQNIADQGVSDPEPDTANDAATKKKWIDRYLKATKPADTIDETETEATELDIEDDSETDASPKNVNKDSVEPSAIKETIIVTQENDLSTNDIVEVIIDSHEADVKTPETDNVTASDITAEKAVTVEIFAVEDGVIMPVPSPQNADPTQTIIVAPSVKVEIDKQARLDTLLSEAALITSKDIREQAYFEILDYVVENGHYDRTDGILAKISDEGLNYTARNRIAVSYAQKGQTEKAFEIVESIEDAELKDFLRLQVIQSIVMPEKVPEALQ